MFDPQIVPPHLRHIKRFRHRHTGKFVDRLTAQLHPKLVKLEGRKKP
jgi:hypothetical protein